MSILNFVDKHYTYVEQVRYLKSMAFFGFPLGYILPKIYLIIAKGWENWHFSLSDLIVIVIVDLIWMSPFIYNYFKYEKKYLKTIKRISLNSNKEYKVKALFDYKNFIKGQTYKVYFDGVDQDFYIDDYYYPLKNLINKFDLDDIKEERLNKLNKLKKLWK